MVIIEEQVEHELRIEKCNKKLRVKDNHHRCYSVKVCIEKNPSPTGNKCAEGRIKVAPGVHVVRKRVPPCCTSQPPPSCPPPSQPVPPPPIKPKRCQKKKCRETVCQTPLSTPPPPCPNKQERECQCSMHGSKKCTRESPCQTQCREVKHCGHQACEQKECRHCECQTELEPACDVVGVSHDRKTCKKKCCSKRRTCEKRDAACEPQTLCSMKKDKCTNCEHPCKQSACEERYAFPFVGRTSSGNLKVRPSMVSYENKEFGILVANPNCIRTTVKRISSCEMIYHHKDSPPPAPAPPPPPCFPRHTCNATACSLCSSKESSCKTAQPWYPPPLPKSTCNSPRQPHHQRHHHHHHHNHHPKEPHYEQGYYHDESQQVNLELAHPSSILNHRGMLANNERIFANKTGPTTVQAHVSHNKLGFADGWNYVNPQYSQEKRDCDCEEKLALEAFPPEEVQQQQQRQSRHIRIRESSKGPSSRKVVAYEEYLHRGKSAYGVELDRGPTYAALQNNFDASASGSRNLGFAGSETPSVPAFPESIMSHRETREMSGGNENDGYGTPTQQHSGDDQRATSGVDHTRQPPSSYPSKSQQPSIRKLAEGEEVEPKMTGTLHYIVKGTVAPDATVAVGDAVFPVHSVVLEIRGNLPERKAGENQQIPPEPEVIENVTLPDFNSLPITYHNSVHEETAPQFYREESVMLEDEAIMTSDRGSKRGMIREQSVHYSSRELQFEPQEPSALLPPSQQVSRSQCRMPPPHTMEGDQRAPTRSQSHLPPGYYNSSRVHPQDSPPLLTPCQSCRSNNTQFHKVPSKAPPSMDLAREQSHMQVPDSDYVESRYLVPIQTQQTILRIVEPDSSIQILEASEEEEGMVGLADHHHHSPPPGTIIRKSSKELAKEEEEIKPTDGLLPNLEIIPGAVLVFGGINPKLPCTTGNTGRDVFMYTRDTDEWTEVGVLPHPRSHFGLARVGNDVYIIGGTDPEHKDENGKNLAVHTNLVVNLRSGVWEQDASLDKARSHFGCVALGKTIFVIGGNIESRATSSCLKFDTETHSWSSIAPLGSTRSNMGIVAYDNGILVAGGTSKDVRRPVLDTVLHYEPTLDRWTAWENLPSPRAFCTLAVTSGNKVYLVAGAGLRDVTKRKNSSLPDVLHYDEERRSWVEAGMLMNSRHGHASVVLEDDSILIIAGISSHVSGAINKVEIWSPFSGASTKAKSIRHTHSGMAAVVL